MLLELKTNAKVARNSDGTKIWITVDEQPDQLKQTASPNNITDPPNSITGILVTIHTKPSLFEPPFQHTYLISNTAIIIPNLVPEYTYNVTVSYSTEYGSLTPTTVVSLGTFDEMRVTVGCVITSNTMKDKITVSNQDMISSISSSQCADLCHMNVTCSYGWTFQLATGNCYFNKAGTNHTEANGWAVGTQSCSSNSGENTQFAFTN